MVPAPFRVVLDACVLYSFTLRDTLLWAAHRDFYQPCWSKQILDEAIRNLVEDEQMDATQAAHLRTTMASAFPAAEVTDYEPYVAAMKNDPKDRHVAACALKAGAQVIVTSNLRDFRDLPSGIEAQSPDEFLCHLFDLGSDAMTELVRVQAARHKNPPHSFDEVVVALAKSAPRFADLLRGHAGT
jgi:predicted nucleic acid-binding protein